jgi:hypothetical protein
MIGMKLLAGLGVAGTIFGLASGYMLGNTHGKRAGAELAIAATTIAAKEVVVKEAQTEQCQAEVAKTNTAVAEQAVETVRVLKEDKAAREAAQREAIARDKRTQKRMDAAFSTLDELRRQIDAGAFQGCANERVGAELLGMLNGALAAEDGGGARRDSDVPPAGRPD